MGMGILLTGLTLAHFCARPKPGPGFPTPYAIVFFLFNWFEVRVFIGIVDFGGIANSHHFS